MVAGNYGRGCGVAPLVTEGAAQDSAELSETSRRAFSELTDRLVFHFVAFGVDRAAARVLAEAVMAGVQGAHRWHETHGQSPAPRRIYGMPNFLDGFHHRHGHEHGLAEGSDKSSSR